MADHAHVFTVFTATYNRAHTLRRVYDSLFAQTFRDFEWVVVDDGSTDDTEALVQAWAAQAPFPVRFFRQAHRHKKAAFNLGVRQARAELFLALDSDDSMPPDALAILHQAWLDIPAERRGQYASVTGLCARPDGTIVGDRYPRDVMDSTPVEAYFGMDVRGEKFGFTRTELLARFPFPEHIEGFVPESVVWWAIARAGYRSRFINRVVRHYEDSADSISRAPVRDTAPGLYLLAHEMLSHHLRYFVRRPTTFLLAAARHVRFGLHLGREGRRAACPQGLRKPGAILLCTVMAPLGGFLYLRDRYRGA
ncbi:glycosyltransferase family A protein [Orrella sp. JC864]|uniref:glycosyltransferase family 2 protein n=1 Tax=Orrella sp. JC864 TaxID=3120298 RepID=UPI00300A54BF